MRKLLSLLCWVIAASTLSASDVKTEVELSQGYRRDSLSWHISGPHGHPNILSELKYKNISVYNSLLNVAISKDNYFGKATAGYGIIYDGTVRDSDFLLDNRHLEFSRSHAHITGDYTFDSTIKLGKHFHPMKSWTLSPSVGYSLYMQKLRDRHGVELAVDKHPTSGKFIQRHHRFHGLNSTYRAQWYGPQMGIRAQKQAGQKVNLYGEYTFLYPLKYEGFGFWNLRDRGERHFRQEAQAFRSFGHIGLVGAAYRLIRPWTLKLEYELMKFYAKGGHLIQNHRRVAPFRKAERTSSEVRLAIEYSF